MCEPGFLRTLDNLPQSSYMDQRIINLYDEYTHKPLTRDVFIRRLIKITGSLTAAMAVLPMIEVNYANAAVTNQDDLFIERISYAGVNGDMKAYVARPMKEDKYAGGLVLHEKRGI